MDATANRKSSRSNFKISPKSIKFLETIIEKQDSKENLIEAFVSSIEEAVNAELK